MAAVAQEKGYDYSLVSEAEWHHESAKGVCTLLPEPPVIAVLECENTAN